METGVKLGIFALGLGSFALSYDMLHSVALASGIWWALAYVYGVLTEGFITIATLTAYVTRGTKASWYPWSVSILAFGYSLWANSAPGTVPPGVARAVPVVALPVAVHLFIVFLHAQARVVEAPAPVVQTVIQEVEKVVEVPAVVGPDIDLEAVDNPKLVGLKLMAHTAENKSSRSYYERQIRQVSASALAVA